METRTVFDVSTRKPVEVNMNDYCPPITLHDYIIQAHKHIGDNGLYVVELKKSGTTYVGTFKELMFHIKQDETVNHMLKGISYGFKQ